MEFDGWLLMVLVGLLSVVGVVFSVTDPNDLKILIDFKNGLDNPELLKWPDNGDDPCGPPSWPHVFCSGNRVSQIQVQNLGLKGPLPQNLNQLTRLSNVGLQRNSFSGKLPSFSGLSELEFAYLDFNEFDTIPSDFFTGLSGVRVLALDYNPFNKTTGWSIPIELENSAQLTNLSLVNCNLVGAVPDFLGTLPSLMALKLSYNRLSGEIPASFGESPMQILWLNDQAGGGVTGSIDVIGKMASLTQLWLHGNQFSGTIPESIGSLTSLKDLNLNRNQLVGLIPPSLASMELDKLDLSNNQLMGPIPTFRAGNVSYVSNSFCYDKAGVQCAPEVTVLLDFLGGMNYPVSLSSQWSGNDPCGGNWLGLSCNPNSKVSIINLPRHNLTGTLSASVAKLGSLVEIRVGENNIHGTVPNNFTELESLRMLDIRGNNLQPPLPKFHNSVKVVIDGNPLLVSNQTAVSPSPTVNPPESSETPSDNPSQGGAVSPPSRRKESPIRGMNSTSGSIQAKPDSNRHGRFIVFAIAGCAAAGLSVLLAMILTLFFCKKRKKLIGSPTSIVVQRKDPCEPRNMVKTAVSKKSSEGFSSQTVTSFGSSSSSVTQIAYGVEGGNLVISVQVLRKVTNNFSNENELGSGGFGTVYKGELEDGTKLAVKRMEGGVVTSKAVDEFQAEIAVLSKVRHRNLVSLLGYSVEGNERLLVYEFMPQGALSRHLFHWRSLKLEPLSWTRRLVIALDVARGIEYLHSLARHTFIHRDLKSSNILLDDNFRAKVSDFGLVKLAPDGEKSVVTRLAGTFGYLAPEYAVMGKITTKVDVFSFGVVLMELLTGLTALDEERPEESRYLAEWFWRIKSSKEMLTAAIDPSLEVNQETSESISTMAELAGHCTARDPNHRPDMGHAVNVLSPLVETWKPVTNEADDCSGIDFSKPLSQMLKVWQASEGDGQSYTSTNDSTGSIPARPVGFADSFTSTDAR